METNSQYRILAVDDEEDLCEIIKFNLEAEGYEVVTAQSAEEALHHPLEKFHLFILDIMMNGMSGFKLAEEIKKKRKIKTPIIFLSAKNTENDKLTGFSLGADDFVSKPFSVRELIARVHAIIKRSNPTQEKTIKLTGIELDIEKRNLQIEGEKIPLTPHEFAIMHLLLKNQGRVFSREDILNYAWKENNYVVDRTIDVHITRLRKKLGIYGKYIVSRSGHGYCFEFD